MKKIAILLSLGVLFTVSCVKSELESKVSNVSSTPCKQDVLKSSELSDEVDVEFTNKGVQITYCNFEAPCDFTTINVTHTFVNGVLNISQQGSPNQANCICYTDVSYTISRISQDEVNVIFINGEQVYCYNENNPLKGNWNWIKTYTPKHGIIDNEFKSILKVFSQNEDSSINYEVIVEDTLFYKGNFQYKYLYDNRIDNINIKLPHWIPTLLADEGWIIHFGYLDLLTEIPSENTLCFWAGAEDGYFYYYQKIR